MVGMMSKSLTYSYDPTKLAENGKDRMRFELGDTLVEGRETTAALSDEEYISIISSTKSWRKAKLKLVESIMRRFSYEVDEKVGPLSLSLHQRYDAWKAMYDQLKKETANTSVPSAGPNSAQRRPPYFFEGMHDNPEAGSPKGGRRLDD